MVFLTLYTCSIIFLFLYVCLFLLISVSISCFFLHLSQSFNHFVASLKHCPSCAMELFAYVAVSSFFQRNVTLPSVTSLQFTFCGIIARSYQTLLMTENLGAQGCVTYYFHFPFLFFLNNPQSTPVHSTVICNFFKALLKQINCII